MTGTSLDGVDVCLIRVHKKTQYLAHYFLPMGEELADELRALNSPQYDEINRAEMAIQAQTKLMARAVATLLARNNLQPAQIRAIGLHGQTLRHRPDLGYTVQWHNGALLAELTGISVVTDFRRRDVAAGGQGAPLAPLFQRAFFPQLPVAIVNLGGFANLTVLTEKESRGFDCGPANVLMDLWIQRHRGASYDEAGAWARSGTLREPLLNAMLADEYFSRPAPKSTGRDEFNGAWLARFPLADYAPADVQRTLLELTAHTVATALRENHPAHNYCLTGGGAANDFLRQRLQELLPGWTTLEPPLPAQALEAAGFGWLACQCLRGRALDLTGSTGGPPRILGAIYPR